MINLANKKFGKLTVLHKNGKTKANSTIWKCLCGCGNETTVDGQQEKNKIITQDKMY